MVLKVAVFVCVSEQSEYFIMSGRPLSTAADDDAIYVNGPQVTASLNGSKESAGFSVCIVSRCCNHSLLH